jgi:hypothetical protein
MSEKVQSTALWVFFRPHLADLNSYSMRNCCIQPKDRALTVMDSVTSEEVINVPRGRSVISALFHHYFAVVRPYCIIIRLLF